MLFRSSFSIRAILPSPAIIPVLGCTSDRAVCGKLTGKHCQVLALSAYIKLLSLKYLMLAYGRPDNVFKVIPAFYILQ